MTGTKPISYRAFAIMVIFMTVGTSILIAPSGLAATAKQDAWIAGLVGCLLDLLLVWLYVTLAERNSGLHLTQICERSLGKWLGYPIAILYTLHFLYVGSLMFGSMGFFMTTQMLKDTPVESVLILFALLVVYSLKAGKQAYAHAAEIFFPWTVALMLVLLVCLVYSYDPDRLQPVFEFGAKPVLKGAYSFFSLQNSVTLLMLYPYIKPGKGRRRSFYTGAFIGVIVLDVLTLACIMMLGWEQTANNLYPTYLLAKKVTIGTFFERLEGALMFIWIISIYIRILLTFQAAITGFSHLLRLKEEKILTWTIVFLGIVIALMCYSNMITVQNNIASSFSTYSLPFLVLFPALMLAATVIRDKRRSKVVKKVP